MNNHAKILHYNFIALYMGDDTEVYGSFKIMKTEFVFNMKYQFFYTYYIPIQVLLKSVQTFKFL